MNRLPEWLRTNTFSGLHDTKKLLRSHGLQSVCEEARCPNKGSCFSKPTATFMILGKRCTRNCSFCSVHHAPPLPVDTDEPERLAMAAKSLNLKHVVITSVTRDDLKDGGSSHFAETVKALKRHLPAATIEVLTPDFKGNPNNIQTVLKSQPTVFNHNVETVPRLYSTVRPQANYETSLSVLKIAASFLPSIKVKSGLMVGLGETHDEVLAVLKDLKEAGCNFVTMGQYLQPRKSNLPVVAYIHPEEFEQYKQEAINMGFDFVASAPLVRSSMDAGAMLDVEQRKI